MSEEKTATGQQCLNVFYDAELDNYDDAIDAALTYHGINKGEIVVIAIPKRVPGGDKRRPCDNQNIYKPFLN